MNSRTSHLASPGSARLSRILLAAVFAVAVFITPLRTIAQQIVIQEPNIELEIKRDAIKSIDGGEWEDVGNPITINDKDYASFAMMNGKFDISGWDHLTALFGISDKLSGDNKSVDIVIMVDDVVVYGKTINKARKIVAIDIPLTGRRRISFSYKPSWTNTWQLLNEGCGLIDAKLVKGNPVSYFDPNVLKMMADQLCDQIDTDPLLKDKLAKSTVGLATFGTINIQYITGGMMAAAAEDMTTAFLRRKLPLIERGKIDEIISGLGITDAANITPDIAQMIAKRTGCQYLIFGTFHDPGGITSKTVIINARIMELSTGKSIIGQRMEISKTPPLQAK